MGALKLNNSTMRVDWDRSNKKEVEDAKTYYREARKEGRKIVTVEGSPLLAFTSSLEAFVIERLELFGEQFAMRIFNKTGDQRLIWDASDPKQVSEAADLFDKYLAKGWKAYKTNTEGKRSQRIYGFDPRSQELFFDEQKNGIKEKLSAFLAADKSREMKLLPRTFPG